MIDHQNPMGMKMENMKMKDEIARRENARHHRRIYWNLQFIHT